MLLRRWLRPMACPRTPGAGRTRPLLLEAALDGASAVPLQIMEKCAEGIALAERYAAKGSVLAVSDAGCAAVLCKAALQAASLNVFINTKLMADRTRAAALDARAERIAGRVCAPGRRSIQRRQRETPQ